MPFWAHSNPPQLLAEHLTNVATLSRQLAERTAPGDKYFQDLVYRAGLFHDLGKYTDGFQKMIQTGEGRGKNPHAIHGACITHQQWKLLPVAWAIAGHHAGLHDHSELKERVAKYSADALALLHRAGTDLPLVAEILKAPFSLPPASKAQSIQPDLFIRMVFSCLVDADRLDTAGRKSSAAPLEAAVFLQKLLTRVSKLKEKSAVPEVQQARDAALADCLLAAEYPERLLSLSVPTGGGKTLAAMAFALQRAVLFPQSYRRIIVVIPFLSIIEQNAQVYADIFGADTILEHHSGSLAKLTPREEHFVPTEEPESPAQNTARLAAENWDAPLIVTTSVRFFETLFSNRPSDLRRAHNVARSIIILDEAQSLPSHLLAPTLAMMKGLSENWGCSFLLSTATQPAFEKSSAPGDKSPRWSVGEVCEVIRSPLSLHQQLRRVHIDWRLSPAVDWPEVASWMMGEQQALCVVNLRLHAATLFDELVKLAKPPNSVFHLSTLMCAAHRLKVIDTVRERLKKGLPCLVVSTQLIEAGVDLDFPVAFRALGPLDSVIQVAGRADREGKLTAAAGRPGGRLVVFKPVDHRTPPNAYEAATKITEALIAKYGSIQADELDRVKHYFDKHFQGTDLGPQLITLQKEGKFRTLAEEFEMISTRLQDVFVPFAEGGELIDELYAIGQLTMDLRRKLQRYTVGLQPSEFFKGCGKAWTELSPDSDIWIASDLAYKDVKGLQVSLSDELLLL